MEMANIRAAVGAFRKPSGMCNSGSPVTLFTIFVLLEYKNVEVRRIQTPLPVNRSIGINEGVRRYVE